MNIRSSDPIEIYVEGNRIILTKYEHACLFCGNGIELSSFKGKKICATCIEEIKSE
jgi:transcriptional pleiotropic regulator of transition state genes